jgi:hypothetical protein
MPLMSSPGAGLQPKQRTINVEVNLLAEWRENRNRLREERFRWTALLTTLAVVGVITVPFLSELAANAQAHAQRAERAALARESTLAELAKQKDIVQPKLDSEATLKLCQARSKIFIGQLLTVLNATTPQMAVEQVDGSILGGELTIRTKAQAESYLAAQQYVGVAGQGIGVKSAILTTARPNSDLAEDGVTFEFAKRIEVGK